MRTPLAITQFSPTTVFGPMVAPLIVEPVPTQQGGRKVVSLEMLQ
jgi:hypothetical protein